MFRATPRLRWNWLKRRMPSKASRMINSDHLSPTMSTARATGQPGLVHVFALTGDPSPQLVANQNHLGLTWFQFTTTWTAGTICSTRPGQARGRSMSPPSTPETTGQSPPGVSTGLAVLLAVACGVAVANVYYAQPLLDQIGHDLGIGPAGLGLVTTVTQVGYLLGLILIVPLGDLINRRVLIVAGAVIAAAALVAVAVSPNPLMFLIASGIVGVASVVQQVIIAYAAVLSSPGTRGRILGIVTSGVV